MNFHAFQLHPKVLAGVNDVGYTDPTPIQKQAIPAVLEGRDIIGLAQTGTGKTAAFVLPILHRLMLAPSKNIRALIIAPTRELAEQIHESILLLGKQTRLKSVTIYGGVSMGPQIEKLRRGADIVVACPGRLLDHLGQNKIDLSHIETLVLDEADQMFDMGFLPDVRKILKRIPKVRQTLLFSATMPPEIRTLAHEILKEPMNVQVDVIAPAVTVSHALYPVSQHLKTSLLIAWLKQTKTESVLVFTRTKQRAKRLAEQLIRKGYSAIAIQGNLSQARRQSAMNDFRKGAVQILVATDIVSRGIDVTQISHVINYDIPSTTDAYIHRIGRTGRAAKTGEAMTFVTQEDARMIRSIEKILGKKINRLTLDGFDYHSKENMSKEESSRTSSSPRSPSPSKKWNHDRREKSFDRREKSVARQEKSFSSSRPKSSGKRKKVQVFEPILGR